jgi:hypothetical protein
MIKNLGSHGIVPIWLGVLGPREAVTGDQTGRFRGGNPEALSQNYGSKWQNYRSK